jgi:UV DNA damage repair endonuclease
MKTKPDDRLRLSLVCMSEEAFAKHGRYRTMTLSQARKVLDLDGEERFRSRLAAIIYHNLNVTYHMVHHCADQGIQGLRISADIFPLMSSDIIGGGTLTAAFHPYEAEQIKLACYAIGQAARLRGVRLSFHGSHYISLTSGDPVKVRNSIKDLSILAQFLDLADMPASPEAPINIHIRGERRSPEDIASAFCARWGWLPLGVQRRLVVEQNDNPDGAWNLERLIRRIHEPLGIPLTFDTLHQQRLPGTLTEREAFCLAWETWPCEPLFHYSDGRAVGGVSLPSSSHRDLPVRLPPDYGLPVMWDVEFKAKKEAVDCLRSMEKIHRVWASDSYEPPRYWGVPDLSRAPFPDGLGGTITTVKFPHISLDGR